MKIRKLFGISVFILIALSFFVCSAHAQGAQDFYNKAKDLINHGMYDQAIVEVTKAIQLDPNMAEYYTLRGELYRVKNDVVSALPDYSKSIELKPENGEVYYFRAICYYFTKQYDLAWNDVHKAQSLGYTVFPYFIRDLQQATGRDK